jgi:hypothetical protein
MNSTLACELCEASVQLVQAELNMSNATVAGISAAVKVLCAALAARAADRECDVIVNSVDKIVSWLSSGFSRLEICQKLRLCAE